MFGRGVGVPVRMLGEHHWEGGGGGGRRGCVWRVLPTEGTEKVVLGLVRNVIAWQKM